MRPLIALLAALALLIPLGGEGFASCAPPASVAENGSRAVAVVYGTVTVTGPGSVTIRVDRVLKGSVASPLTVFVGPGRGGTGGVSVATSVDYRAETGTDHVLYVIRGEDGQLETNACIGSHSGAPTSEENAHFAGGSGPSAPTAPVPLPGAPAQQGSSPAPTAPVPSPEVRGQQELSSTGLLLAGAAVLAGIFLALHRLWPRGGRPTG
jgi:hypothetical protein